MAGTLRRIRLYGPASMRALREEHNRLVDDVEAIRAALVAHGAAAHGTVALTASQLTAAKIEQ